MLKISFYYNDDRLATVQSVDVVPRVGESCRFKKGGEVYTYKVIDVIHLYIDTDAYNPEVEVMLAARTIFNG